MALTHSLNCVHVQEAFAEYIRLYPNACRKCNATGEISYPYTRDDPGGADPCAFCIEEYRCPRCHVDHGPHWRGEICKSCGWSFGREQDWMPVNECICSWEIVCPDCKGVGAIMVVVGNGEAYPTQCSGCAGEGQRWLEGPIDIPEQPEIWAILGEIFRERARQDPKWGGPAHDDIHNPAQWAVLIMKRMQTLASSVLTLHTYRKLLIEVAAMCVAAAQTLDRQQGRNS
jgi:hypothetical protein